jgi:hypothetical protein
MKLSGNNVVEERKEFGDTSFGAKKLSPMKKSSSHFLKADSGGMESIAKNKNLVKRVENTLKNFEIKNGSVNHQEFFKTKTMAVGSAHGSGSGH